MPSPEVLRAGEFVKLNMLRDQLTHLLRLAEEKNYKGQKIPEGDFASYGHWSTYFFRSIICLIRIPRAIAQCMWKSSTKIGIGAASNGKGGYYTAARYSPPGNYAGQKPY